MRTPSAITAAICGASLLAATLLLAQGPSASGGLNLVATTANVSGAGDSVRFEILRWSTDEERDSLMAAWTLRPTASAGKAGAGAAKGGAGKGAAKGRGAAPVSDSVNSVTPEASLAKALQETTTAGYLWSSEMAGYALRFAGKIGNPDGTQRIILITQRRLGAVNQLWNPTFDGTPNTDEFSVIELRLSAKGEGEGKVSLVGKAALDAAAKIVTLENYNALPAVFRNVRMQAGKP